MIGRPNGPAVGPRDVQCDRQTFGQNQTVLLIGRDLALRIDRQKFGRCGVQRRIGGGEVFQPVGLDDRNMNKRHPQFL